MNGRTRCGNCDKTSYCTIHDVEEWESLQVQKREAKLSIEMNRYGSRVVGNVSQLRFLEQGYVKVLRTR